MSDKKEKKDPGRIRRSVQDSIPYLEAYENGIFRISRNRYSATYRLPDLGFSLAAQQDQELMFTRYCMLLNSVSDADIQISCVSRYVDADGFRDRFFLKSRDDGLDVYRDEVNSVLEGNLAANSGLETGKYITLTVAAESLAEAETKLGSLERSLSDSFRTLGAGEPGALDLDERLTLLHSSLQPDSSERLTADVGSLRLQGITTKDLIAPPGMRFLPMEAEIGELRACSLFLVAFPPRLSTDFFMSLCAVPCPMLASVHLRGVDQDKASKLVRNQLVNIGSNILDRQKRASRSGYAASVISPDLEAAREEAEQLLEDITKQNQRLFYCTVSVTVFAPDRETLSKNVSGVEAVGRRFGCCIRKLGYQQEQGLGTALPLGNCLLDIRSLVTTQTAGLLIPFSTRTFTQKGGLYYGRDAVSGNMILFNRLSSKNPSGVILGTPGCVDADTEFFTGTGWKRISAYSPGDRVLQYDPATDTACTVLPERYIKEPCGVFYRFRSPDTDQLLSAGHRVLYWPDGSERPVRCTAADLFMRYDRFRGRIKTGFRYCGGGLDLTDGEIRRRLGPVLSDSGETVPPYWYGCSAAQLGTVCGLVSETAGQVFRTRDRAAADFIQFAFAATGRGAVMDSVPGPGGGTVYELRVTGREFVRLFGSGPEEVTEMSAETSPDGFRYCFTVPSHCLVLRRNGRIFVTGNSGKSFSAKREMMSVLLGTDSDIYVIDPEREYAGLAKMLGGEVIHISAGSGTYINPLDMDRQYADDDADPVTLKSDFICSFCEAAAGGRYGLSQIEKSITDRCVRKIYAPYMEYLASHPGVDNDRERVPTLVDLYETLIRQPEPEAQTLALSLELFCIGSFDLFAHRTNTDTGSRFIVYDIRDVGANLRELGLHVCLNDIWNRTIANKAKRRRTWFYIDEFYLLTQTESSAAFLQQIFKRARKWGGVPTGITQNVEDLLRTSESRTILNNCDFVMMLNQAPLDRETLTAMYHISPSLQHYITSSGPGSGLLYTGSSIVPFSDEYPENTRSFGVMTTDPDHSEQEEQQ